MTKTDRDVLRVLRGARALLARRDGWNSGCLARSLSGESVSPHSRQAVSWCAVGAIDRVSRVADTATREHARGVVLHATGARVCALARWNDARGRTQRQVVAAFDSAIRSLTRMWGR